MDEQIGQALSLWGLGLQLAGVVAVAVVFALLRFAVVHRYFDRWAQAWGALAVALVALQLSFLFPAGPWRWPLQWAYFFGEYLFALLLIGGFATYPQRDNEDSPLPRWAWWVLGTYAALLTPFTEPFAQAFAFHAPVFATGLLWAAVSATQLQTPAGGQWAKWGLVATLSVLALNFFANAAAAMGWVPANDLFAMGYSAYQSVVDLFIEAGLALSLLALATLDLRAAALRTRAALEGERDRMVMLAHRDALTGCFNRLALDELSERLAERDGALAVIDLNGLKRLNDGFGHDRGDLAICYAAHALSGLLREQDHIFRTGGDEFLLVAFGIDAETLHQRLSAAHGVLQSTYVPGTHGVELGMAFGVATFQGRAGFDAAMQAADARMYEDKRRKAGRHADGAVAMGERLGQ